MATSKSLRISPKFSKVLIQKPSFVYLFMWLAFWRETVHIYILKPESKTQANSK